MMYYPTGMGRHTGHHYHNVAAQMHAYLNDPGYQYPYYAKTYHGGGGYGGGYADLLQYSAQQFGIDPMVVSGATTFARSFMYNLLS
ncbi:unnamed protein product [Rotaria sp. Silwood1]|nr:unnamed protein product [Rotaria sp. Silwood1]CAF3334404.1 unnamed protein product [Rotaria sp. Silwood1]CAF4846194.1 unnamed protein product [Rotaria sp. Silwood1]